MVDWFIIRLFTTSNGLVTAAAKNPATTEALEECENKTKDKLWNKKIKGNAKTYQKCVNIVSETRILEFKRKCLMWS